MLDNLKDEEYDCLIQWYNPIINDDVKYKVITSELGYKTALLLEIETGTHIPDNVITYNSMEILGTKLAEDYKKFGYMPKFKFYDLVSWTGRDVNRCWNLMFASCYDILSDISKRDLEVILYRSFYIFYCFRNNCLLRHYSAYELSYHFVKKLERDTIAYDLVGKLNKLFESNNIPLVTHLPYGKLLMNFTNTKYCFQYHNQILPILSNLGYNKFKSLHEDLCGILSNKSYGNSLISKLDSLFLYKSHVLYNRLLDLIVSCIYVETTNLDVIARHYYFDKSLLKAIALDPLHESIINEFLSKYFTVITHLDKSDFLEELHKMGISEIRLANSWCFGKGSYVGVTPFELIDLPELDTVVTMASNTQLDLYSLPDKVETMGYHSHVSIGFLWQSLWLKDILPYNSMIIAMYREAMWRRMNCFDVLEKYYEDGNLSEKAYSLVKQWVTDLITMKQEPISWNVAYLCYDFSNLDLALYKMKKGIAFENYIKEDRL